MSWEVIWVSLFWLFGLVIMFACYRRRPSKHRACSIMSISLVLLWGWIASVASIPDQANLSWAKNINHLTDDVRMLILMFMCLGVAIVALATEPRIKGD